MSKKLPQPDFSHALPPRVPPLDPDESDILKVLQRKRGRLYTVTEILTVMGENINIGDNHAGVIRVITLLCSREKCEEGWVGEGHTAQRGWMIPKPKEVLDGALAR